MKLPRSLRCLTQSFEVLVSHVVHLGVDVPHLSLERPAEVLLLAEFVQ